MRTVKRLPAISGYRHLEPHLGPQSLNLTPERLARVDRGLIRSQQKSWKRSLQVRKLKLRASKCLQLLRCVAGSSSRIGIGP